MLRKLSILAVSILLFSIIAGCSSSHTQEEYDELLAEKEDLQEQYDALMIEYDPLYASNQTAKQEVDDLQAAIDAEDWVFNDDLYDSLTNENYNGDDLQDQRLWGTYYTDANEVALYVLYSSGFYVCLYMTTDSYGQYSIYYGSYCFDSDTGQLAFDPDIVTSVYKVTFTDTGLLLGKVSGNSYDEWTLIRVK